MLKNKIHPLILLALFITSITWLLHAYSSFSNEDIGLGIIYTVLFLFLFGMGIWGLISNKKLKGK